MLIVSFFFFFKLNCSRWAFSSTSLSASLFYIRLPHLINLLVWLAFLSTSDYLPGSIGNSVDLLDHLVGPGPSRSSALHGASWIPYYAGLPPSHETGRPRPCSFIRRHHYLVAMEGWSWSLHQGGRALLRPASRASCYCRSSE